MKLHLLNPWPRTDSGRGRVMVSSCVPTGACTRLQWIVPNPGTQTAMLYLGGHKTKQTKRHECGKESLREEAGLTEVRGRCETMCGRW